VVSPDERPAGVGIRIGGKTILGAAWPTRHRTRKMWRTFDRGAPIGYRVWLQLAPSCATSGQDPLRPGVGMLSWITAIS